MEIDDTNAMFVNKTDMSEDPDYVSHGHHDHGASWQNLRTATTAISIIISFLALLFDIILIFVTKRYKALKIRNNQYLFHYACCNILFLCSNSIVHLVMDVFFEGFLPKEWYCSLVQLENYFLNLCIVFIGMYAIDEYIRVTCEKNFRSYNSGFRYFIFSVYALHIILMMIVSGVCFSHMETVRFDISFIIVTITYVVFLVFVLKIKYTVARRLYDTQTQLLSTVLEITLIVYLFYLPVVVYYNLLNIFDVTDMEGTEIWADFAFIPEYIAYCATFIIVYKLYKLNKFFKLAFCKVMCQSRKDMDYSRLDTTPEELCNK
ncbi:uncharacterized protein LOC143200332 isoform X2 [Rhynchophorus ferrugineus]|uniref:uncharacterized protein LOC143200332 isoform X2 n=1 Tax=Rhynchophorus ferrugineus TaxID=354439 RepID=UPI003FCED96B